MITVSYKEKIIRLKDTIPNNVVDLSISRKRGTAPTQAFSDFLTHSEQGDWAELLLYKALSGSSISYVPVRYGKSDKITAGDPGFKDFYNSYQDELDSIGKRPDLLVFEPDKYDNSWGDDISNLSMDDLNPIVSKAAAGFEVRSSAYLSKKFIPKTDRPNLSYTPKVEDLLIVLKWIETYGVPHFYVQVFFDRIFIISFEEILNLLINADIEEKGIKNKKLIGSIDSQRAFVIEKNPKNQFKETIHIYLDRGHILADSVSEPGLKGNRKELQSGRLLHYVTFNGGNTLINKEQLIRLIRNSQ